MEARSFALPLYALVAREKVDPASAQMPDLLERLRLHLAEAFSIESLDARMVMARGEPMFVLDGVPPHSLPALFALADVQRVTLSEYRRESADRFSLTPLAVKP